MKALKIDGEIIVLDKMNLNDFCELFNSFLDDNNCGFNGFIKDIIKTEKENDISESD